MNALSWKMAAGFIAHQSSTTQHPQAAVMAHSNQLETLPLSELCVDDSGPLQVNYGSDVPLSSSTPCAPLTPDTMTEYIEPYQQILPGITD